MDEIKDPNSVPPVPSVEVGELLPRLDRGDKVLLLDVRNQDEYESWKVEPRRAVETLHVPYFDFIEDTDDWDIYLSFGGSEGVGWYQSQLYYSCDEGIALKYLKLSEARGECDLYDPLFEKAVTVVGDEQDAVLHELALLLNENLPEIYVWQPNYLHVYSDRLGGDFAIYPNERESFQKILDWTYAP